MAEATFHFIQYAFPKRTIRKAQLTYCQRIKNAAQDSQSGDKNRFPLLGQPWHTEC
ncbi:hypothetical protein D3C73_1353510 [compost metagenome]